MSKHRISLPYIHAVRRATVASYVEHIPSLLATLDADRELEASSAGGTSVDRDTDTGPDGETCRYVCLDCNKV